MEKKKWNARKIRYWVTMGLLIAVIITCITIIAVKMITDARNQEGYDNLDNTKDSAEAEEDRTRPSITETVPTEPTEEDEPPSLPSMPDHTRPTVIESEPTSPISTKPMTTQPTVAEPAASEPSEPLEMLFQYQVMYNINNDTVGWIEIPGTSVDYPVVQSPYEANFYLRKNFYKEKATCGTIYVREACDVFKPSDNVTIYGHNMRNGTMFADLHLYEDQDFWADNKYVYFDTLYEYHAYEIFAVFISTADLSVGFSYHTFDDARNQAEFDQFVATCKELALYDTGITPQYGEKLITLSTCDKSIEEGRFVVVARRIY